MNKNKYLIMPRCSKYTHIQQCLSQIAEILGYNVIVYNKPTTDSCRGHRAERIEWVDDLLDFPNDIIKPIDKPLN